MSRTAVVGHRALWFRSNDLRLDDNTALQAAHRDAKSLLPVYVFDPSCFNTLTKYGGARKSSARRARFLLECVASLRQRLETYGSGLAVGVGSPSEIVPKFSADCEAVFVTEGFCSEEKREEAQVARKLVHGEVKRIWGGTLFFPNELGNNPDNIPLGHMQFRSNCRQKGRIRDAIPEPSRLPPLPDFHHRDASAEISKALKFMPSLQDLGYSAEEVEAAHVDDPRGVMVWQGGEEAAWARLQKWMFDDDHLKDYRDIQNGMVGEGYSSKLSPWIARGCISPRRIREEALRYEAQRMIKNFSTYWLPNMLEWRDFMIYIARSQGDRIFKLGGIIGDRSPWHGTKEDLQAWKEGRTGEEIVDAAMKELLFTGYMAMRARHIVATYLVYDLGVDWRHGAAHFEEHLLDYDPALNWIMWMQAPGLLGRGGKHQGLLHFSVKKSVASQRKQLSNHAPDRAYIRHWLENHRDVAANGYPNQGAPNKRHTSGQRVVHLTEDVPAEFQFAEAVDMGKGNHRKGKGKHRGDEHADALTSDDAAKRPKKNRWGRKME
eukprot:gnl/MRDRNA2_/MRDRNA2_91304_c0_seq1.p1 gnl/MRDRNA2_/MRDRNA2_91304_c0~~gnl/MRDRNA2_/MRDRNA2_91304_c0_seq1.p1  ORF type:complete len:548 (-),score=72.76 gnl/MRDRNA2_/MRDRNA2_91304_c0_seq1:85-1728(-)